MESGSSLHKIITKDGYSRCVADGNLKFNEEKNVTQLLTCQLAQIWNNACSSG